MTVIAVLIVHEYADVLTVSIVPRREWYYE